MKIKKSIFQIVLLPLILYHHSASGIENNSGLIAPGASLITVSDSSGGEGPTADENGDVYYSAGHSICKWTWEDGKTAVYRENIGANGTMFDAEGRLVICEMNEGRVTRDNMKGNLTVLADSCDGKKFANPNDLWIDPKGGIYVSVFSMTKGPGPAAERRQQALGGDEKGWMHGEMPGGDAGSEATGEVGIFYISPDGGTVTRVTDDTGIPNGLIGTPDGRKIYIGDNAIEKIWSYEINPDGTLSGKKLFCENASDGMTLDENGNVYLTAEAEDAVLIYSPEGDLLEKIATPDKCANVEFAGKDRKTLFITARGHIYTLEMAVKGAPPLTWQ